MLKFSGSVDIADKVIDVIARHGVTPILKAARVAGCNAANRDQMIEAVQEMKNVRADLDWIATAKMDGDLSSSNRYYGYSRRCERQAMGLRWDPRPAREKRRRPARAAQEAFARLR